MIFVKGFLALIAVMMMFALYTEYVIKPREQARIQSIDREMSAARNLILFNTNRRPVD